MFVQLLSIIPYSSSSHLNVLFRSVWRVAKGSYIGGKAIFASAPLSLCSRRHRVPSSGSALTLALILVSRLGGTRVPAISFCVRQLKYAKMKVASRFLSEFKKRLAHPSDVSPTDDPSRGQKVVRWTRSWSGNSTKNLHSLERRI